MNDEIDLEALDAYLSSDESPYDCMMLSDLDGFLHGAACGPELIPAEEWMLKALGAAPTDIPAWVISMIGLRYCTILRDITAKNPIVEPIFWQASEGHVIAMDWCEGFMEAVAMRRKLWLRLTESGAHGALMKPIMTHILDDNGNSALGIPQHQIDHEIDKAANAIPEAVVQIFQFWRSEGSKLRAGQS